MIASSRVVLVAQGYKGSHCTPTLLNRLALGQLAGVLVTSASARFPERKGYQLGESDLLERCKYM